MRLRIGIDEAPAFRPESLICSARGTHRDGSWVQPALAPGRWQHRWAPSTADQLYRAEQSGRGTSVPPGCPAASTATSERGLESVQ